MKVFHGTSFSPDTIAMMTEALRQAVETLPEPVSSGHVQALAKNIVDLTTQGERDPERLKLLALRCSPGPDRQGGMPVGLS